MANILSVVTTLVHGATYMAMSYLSLFFTWETTNEGQVISGVTWLGIFCVILPLVGLGIGIIRRLVSIRA